MIAVQGYFDGKNIKLPDDVKVKPNQRVIVTIMDDFIQPEGIHAKSSMRGVLSDFADPKLKKQEEGAWEHAVVDKYGDS